MWSNRARADGLPCVLHARTPGRRLLGSVGSRKCGALEPLQPCVEAGSIKWSLKCRSHHRSEFLVVTAAQLVTQQVRSRVVARFGVPEHHGFGNPRISLTPRDDRNEPPRGCTRCHCDSKLEGPSDIFEGIFHLASCVMGDP